VVFFFAGVASVNFLLRSAGVVFQQGWLNALQFFSLLPFIYLAIFAVRFVGMFMVSPILKALGSPLTTKNILFSTAGGLRGALCLILVQNMIQSNIKLGDLPQEVLEVRGEMALWASGYVLMTLLINAPLLGKLLEVLKLTETTKARKLMRQKAKRALKRFTEEAIKSLEYDNDEMLRGTDWDAVKEYVITGYSTNGSQTEAGSSSVASSSTWFRRPANSLDRRYSRQVTSAMKKENPIRSDQSSLHQSLLEIQEEEGEQSALGTIHSTSAQAGSLSVPAGELMGDDDKVDDSDAVFHSFRRTGKMNVAHDEAVHMEGISSEPPTSHYVHEPSSPGVASFSLSAFCTVDIGLGVEEAKAEIEPSDTSSSYSAGHTNMRSLLLRQPSGRRSSFSEMRRRLSLEQADPAQSSQEFQESVAVLQRKLESAQGQEQYSLSSSDAENPSMKPFESDMSDRVDSFLERQAVSSPMHEQGQGSTSISGPVDEEAALIPEVSKRENSAAGNHQWSKMALDLQRTMSLSAFPSREADVVVEGDAFDPEEIAQERRIRLYMGLKRYFQHKRTEGLLSAHGLLILNEAVDLSLDRPERKLQMWKIIEKEACGKFYTACLSKLLYHLRNFRLWKYQIPWLHDKMYYWILQPIVNLINWRLSYTMTLSVEVAIEYWLSLRHSPNAIWLVTTASKVVSEIEDEMDKVWQFIVDREVEAPERFKLVQSYRATIAILRQQQFFVEKLFKSGLLDEGEAHHLHDEVHTKLTKLEETGPGWKQPSLTQICRALPFFSNISGDVFEWINRHAFLVRLEQGQVILSQDNAGNGMYIVVTGLVESKYKEVMPGFNNVWMAGTGGVVGLVASLTCQKVPGAADVVARGNPLGKGPVLMHIPQYVVNEIRKRAADGVLQFLQLETNLFRLAALNYVERLRPVLVEMLSQSLLSNQEAEKKAKKAKIAKSHWTKVKAKVVVTTDDDEDDESSTTMDQLHDDFKTAAELQVLAHRMVDSIVQDFHDGSLKDLKVGESFTLDATCVLLAGELHGPISTKRPTSPMEVIRGPHMFVQQESQAAKQFVAGPRGATIITCSSEGVRHFVPSSSNLRSIITPH